MQYREGTLWTSFLAVLLSRNKKSGKLLLAGLMFTAPSGGDIT